MTTPRRPIPSTPALAFIFNIIGGLILLAAVAVAVGAAMQFKSTSGSSLVALPIVGALVFSGILYLGVAEVIQLIARIAIEAGRQADAVEQQRPAPLYLYLVGEETRGPVSMDVLRSLRSLTTGPRYVTGETIVCKVGETDWKRLADTMDKPAAPVAPAKPESPARAV
ncbi:MAG: hypothetical protein P4L99_27160 [Chthoniobacter sp.]|nr:hypothetical protein [Chthoniobacter sp.]